MDVLSISLLHVWWIYNCSKCLIAISWLLFDIVRYVVYMDANGDTQGNYTLIGRQPIAEDFHHEQGLYPVGVFHIPQNHSTIPVSAISIFHFWIEKKKKMLGTWNSKSAV